MTDIRVSLVLTKEEALGVQTILDQLINIDLFKEIPYDSYTALEKFIKSTYDGLQNEANKDMMSAIWGEECLKCKHTSNFHTGHMSGEDQTGYGFCCAESCNCMLYQKPKKL